jgi:hypothetical protein
MGCGMSTEEKEGKQRNEEIENQLKRDKMMQRNEIKMLLLGQYPSSTPPFHPTLTLRQVPVNLASRPSLSR